ncbi:MAG: NACHT domain-containing protein, partial [Oscillochloris sp.]|nr:NACHT domain-containing protein [Oscillochloris sp.]
MPDADLLQYCRSLRENPEFARWGTDAYIPLSAIAVPLGLPWEAVANQIDDAPPSEEVVRAIHRALSRADQQLVTVIGPAFSGQTSAMRRLAWQLADRPAEGAPIFVDLARYTAQPAGARRLTYVISEAVAASAAALAETIEGLLAKPTPIEQRFVFILDGLEQVQIQLRSDLIRELLGLANHKELDKQRFVLSCRREALPPELAGKAQLLLIRYLSGREVLGYLRARAGSTDQGNNRFGQILNAHLLDLAALPPLLAEILKRLESRQSSRLTRNQLLQDELEAQLAELPPQFQRGDVARQSLITLAWEISKQPDEALDLNDAFVLLGRVRRERGYSLEELYEQLCDARLLHDVDRRRTAFQRPAQRAYCAALALHQSANITSLIDNLLPQCAVLERHERWGSALISLAGMLAEPTPLERIARAGRATNNGLYMVLLARCLQALPRDVFKSLSPRLRGALLDACAGWADPAREPVAERRAQIADALGCLPDATSVRTLLRLACERIRPAINPRLDYEYTNVRLSAALGLRNLMLFRSPDHPAGSALWLGIAPET